MKKLIKARPMFNRLITTMDTYEDDLLENGLVVTGKTKGSIKEYQTVLAVGDTVRGIKEGDIVVVNPTRYKVVKHNENSLKNGIIDDNMTVGYRFNTIMLDDKECLVLYDQDIDFVVEECVDVPDATIKAPDKPKIIL